VTHTLCHVGQDGDDNDRDTRLLHGRSLGIAVDDKILDWIEVAECAVQACGFLAV